jgi:hypothetical protein
MTKTDPKAAGSATRDDPAANAASAVESLPLRVAVGAAARAALLANRFVDHAALHSLELALADVRHRLKAARLSLGDTHEELLRRVEVIL